MKVKSERSKLRKKIGALLLEKLKKDRKNEGRCEICGRKGVVGKFHILSVGSHPRLEFVEKNILLTDWFPCHYAWHHHGPHDPRTKHILDRIMKLLGDNWEQELREIENAQGKHDGLYLLALYQDLNEYLKNLKGNG
jgi:hypothetical protein